MLFQLFLIIGSGFFMCGLVAFITLKIAIYLEDRKYK